eukprot:SAG11_NODE_6656_length_1272_cov_1.258312_2_plen_134_part_00
MFGEFCIGHAPEEAEVGRRSAAGDLYERAALTAECEAAVGGGIAALPPLQLIGLLPPLPGVNGAEAFRSIFRAQQLVDAAAARRLITSAERAGIWELATHTPYPTYDTHIDALAATVRKMRTMQAPITPTLQI